MMGTSTLSDLSKEVRARVSHQLMTRQHRQAGTIYRSNEIFATEQDIVDGTFMYMLSNVEKGFDAVESSRTLFKYTNKNLIRMIDVPIPSQWKSLLKGVSLRTLPSFVHHFEKIVHAIDGEKLTKKRYLSIIGKASEKI
jgi:hypothetical protein